MELVSLKTIFVVVLTGLFTGMVMTLQGYHGLRLFSAETMVGSRAALEKCSLSVNNKLGNTSIKIDK